MATLTVDLWPDDIVVNSILVAPVTILKQQAALLGEKTYNVLIGEVRSESFDSTFVHGFYISAPTLNYSYRLFGIRHSVELYPLYVELDDGGTITVADQEGLAATLRSIFSAEKTKRIIHGLIAQSEP